MRTIIFSVLFAVGIFRTSTSTNQFGEGELITETACEAEIERLAEENCGLALSNTFLTNLLIKYRDNEISGELFASFASIYCIRMLGQTNCLLSVLPTTLNPICKFSYAYDAKILIARLNQVSAQFYCENDMKRLNDTLPDDGITCLYTQEFMDCKIRNLTPNAIRTATANLCESLDANILCENLMGTCTNPNVKQYQYQLSRLSKRGVGCPI